MYRLIVESLLGLTLEKNRLRFAPCLPADWPAYTMRYRYGETAYDIAVRQATGGDGARPADVTVDGIVQADDSVLLVDDGIAHEVLVDVHLPIIPFAPSPPSIRDSRSGTG
jgi:cyclic beta-1,2-glucan synthetase